MKLNAVIIFLLVTLLTVGCSNGASLPSADNVAQPASPVAAQAASRQSSHTEVAPYKYSPGNASAASEPAVSKANLGSATQAKGAVPAAPKPRPFDSEQTEAIVIQLINQARAGAGLQPLSIDPNLTEIARTRSQDLVARNYFGHKDPVTGESLAKTLFDQRGYRNYTAGENLAVIQSDVGSLAITAVSLHDPQSAAQEFLTGWMNSPSHRDNILYGEFRRTGVGVFVSPDGTRIMVTQIFMN